MPTAVLLFISKLYEFSVKNVWNYVLHKNGANFYYNKGTAIKIWNLILHIGLMSIKAVSWINSTFEKNKFRLTFTWKCPVVTCTIHTVVGSRLAGKIHNVCQVVN